MAELLLELLSEEIPARMQARAAANLKRLVCDGLKEAGLEYDSAGAYVTPRRLTLVVDGLPSETPDISEERRGPATSAPEKAVQGFLGSVGLTIDQVEKRETKKGKFYFGHDTGFMFLSLSLNIPAIGLFGEVSPYFYSDNMKSIVPEDEIFGENCIKNISFENAKSKLDKFISLYKL